MDQSENDPPGPDHRAGANAPRGQQMAPDEGRAALKPMTFHVLLALSENDRHGLGIADEIEATTAGGISPGPATLYRTLREMAGDGLIREVEAPAGADPRRKFYAITETGRDALAVEASRYARILRVARARNVVDEEA